MSPRWALFGLALAISGLATGRIMYQNSKNLLHKGLGYPEASIHAWIPRNLGRVIVRSGRGGPSRPMQRPREFSEKNLNPSDLPWTVSIDGSSKLTYMPFVEALFGIMEQNGIAPRPIDVDPCFLSRGSTNSKTQARIGCLCFRTEHFRRVRLEYIDAGPKAQILNALFYPNYDNEAPLLGIDLLSFNEDNRILIGMDYHPLTQSSAYNQKYIKPLEALRSQYPELQGEVSNRIYDSFEFFSPGMLFGRFQSSERIQSRVLPVFDTLVKEYLKLVETGGKTIDYSEEWIRSRQHAYNRYNFENDPAAGIFSSYFGKEWSENFMSEFLFEIDRSRHTVSSEANSAQFDE
ncbi:hypothetical protein AAMO2058_000484300 [Amorphochlora amoebiformis]